MMILMIALALDALIGDPDWLWRRIPHPVVLFGGVIDRADRMLNGAGRSQRAGMQMAAGVLVVVLLVSMCLAIFVVTDLTSKAWPLAGFIAETAIVTILIAQRSLYDHVSRVMQALETGELEAGRQAVGQIVGRDVSQLDEAGVLEAAIESLAENFADGVVAPVFWYAVAGLPGILIYKAVNTADSMIGHRNSRYEHFGKPTARLDDILNWPAARLAAMLVAICVAATGGRATAGGVWRTTVQDASGHRSPNAGWPETAFAAALGIRLGGDRTYGSETVCGVTLNAQGRRVQGGGDINQALRLFVMTCIALFGLCFLGWLAGTWF